MFREDFIYVLLLCGSRLRDFSLSLKSESDASCDFMAVFGIFVSVLDRDLSRKRLQQMCANFYKPLIAEKTDSISITCLMVSRLPVKYKYMPNSSNMKSLEILTPCGGPAASAGGPLGFVTVSLPYLIYSRSTWAHSQN